MKIVVERVEALVIEAGGWVWLRPRASSLAEREVMEHEAAIDTSSSPHDGKLLQAGIYYPAGSLKAQLCVRGKWSLHAYF